MSSRFPAVPQSGSLVLRTARFLHRFLRPDPSRVRVERVRMRSGDDEVEALLYRPRRGGSVPGWIALHGLTVTGHLHPSLTRFAQALAASGTAVLVPEIPAWRALRINLDAAFATLHGGARYLAQRADVREGGIGVAGFSFGGTQALIAAADPRLAPSIRTVAAFGAYADLGRTTRCMFTGEHEWQGVLHRLDPDPYGRWIMGANYLTGVPGYEGMSGVADALRELAAEAGARGVFAWEPEYDGLKRELRTRLRSEEKPVWDLFAPPAGELPADLEHARALAQGLTEAGYRAEPRGDPLPALPRLRCRVALAHGRSDRLIPFTETLRLRFLLPSHVEVYSTVIRSFAHSTEALRIQPLEYGREAYRFLRLLGYALDAR